MSDITKKFSLLDKINNIQNNNNYNNKNNIYHFHDVGKIIINDVYILLPLNAVLEVALKNNFITFTTITSTSSNIFEIEYEKL